MARALRSWLPRILFPLALIAGLTMARAWFERQRTDVAKARPSAAESALVGRPLPALERASGWIGPRPHPDSLARRVVAIVFWSGTQPRSLRVVEQARAWHEAYGRFGLEVIGVHVPEFAFAADSAHVAAAVRRLGIGFPVALDPGLGVWGAFGGGDEPPRVVLAEPAARGAEGAGKRPLVVTDREGADAVRGMEGEIRSRLEALRPGLRFPATSPGEGGAVRKTGRAAVHLGRARVAAGPLTETAPGRPITFAAQIRQQVEGSPYVPYPVGRWKLGGDGLTAVRGGASNFVALRYDAGPLGAVMGPPERGPARVWILRDERWLKPGEMGEDVRLDGRGASFVLVTEPRLYSLCREGDGQHIVKLSPEEPGVTLYAFTFEPWGPARPAGP